MAIKAIENLISCHGLIAISKSVICIGPRSSNNTTVGVNKVTGVTESFPSNLNTFWKSLNILHLSYLDG